MYSLEECINLIETHPEKVQLSLLNIAKHFVASSSDDHIDVDWDIDNTILITDGFITIHKKYYKLQHVRTLIKELDSIAFPFPNTLKHNKDGTLSTRAKQEWCRNNHDIVVSYYPQAEYKLIAQVYPTENMFKYIRDICEYLKRKFIDEKQTHYINGKKYEFISPIGSSVIDYENLIFEFSPDKITNLLNQYNANRCISKKSGKIIEYGDIIVKAIFQL